MAITYVYNQGKPIIEEGKFGLVFGMFFDGTLNNRENSRLRKKYRNQGKDTITGDEEKAAIRKEEAAYDALKNKDFSPNDSEYDRYIKGVYRSKIDKMGMDNSYSNDYSNVARTSFCCETSYAIYTEGIGTLDQKRDVDDGFQFGSGITGIRGKVRIGCESLADKISSEKQKEANKELSTIVLDVFGFSRGAAAARNFVYEVNSKPAYPYETKLVKDGYSTTINPMGGMPAPNFKEVKVDSDGEAIDTAVLVNGKLPRMGHLGYTLIKNGVFTAEELKDIRIIIRFIGVYDTVSSYAEYGDMGFLKRSGVGISHVMSNKFKKGVKELHLNELGSYNKAVHYTAENEHRDNFALTRMPGAHEKNLPGVHCDIGGAYETGNETVDEIETDTRFIDLEKCRQNLIDQHWFKEDQLKIINMKQTIAGNDFTDEDDRGFWSTVAELFKRGFYNQLSGKRFLKKEYSYIPLHFMEREYNDLMKDNIMKSVVKDYDIDFDPVLKRAKVRLGQYVFDNREPLKFMTDDEVKREKELKKMKEDMDQMMKNPVFESVQDNLRSPIDTRMHDMRIPIQTPIPKEVPPENPEEKVIQLEEVVITGYTDQGLIRKLRNEYFHWSANRDWFGMGPAKDRKRAEY